MPARSLALGTRRGALTSRQLRAAINSGRRRASRALETRTASESKHVAQERIVALQWWPCCMVVSSTWRQGSGQACTSAPAQIEGRSEPDTCLKYLTIYMYSREIMLDVRAECRRTGRGAVVASRNVLLNCNASRSAPPGTYAAIAVVILASVCHCATTMASWREGP
jgi:hypothetical protein